MDANLAQPRCEDCGRLATVHVTKCETDPSGQTHAITAHFCEDCAPPQGDLQGDIDEIKRRFAEAIYPVPVRKWLIERDEDNRCVCAVIDDEFKHEDFLKRAALRAQELGVSGVETTSAYLRRREELANRLSDYAALDSSAVDRLFESGITDFIQVGFTSVEELCQTLGIDPATASKMIQAAKEAGEQL